MSSRCSFDWHWLRCKLDGLRKSGCWRLHWILRPFLRPRMRDSAAAALSTPFAPIVGELELLLFELQLLQVGSLPLSVCSSVSPFVVSVFFFPLSLSLCFSVLRPSLSLSLFVFPSSLFLILSFSLFLPPYLSIPFSLFISLVLSFSL